ncbi:hypothetical protein LR48_Vigan10g108600 [Vigna angularis]|uniref:Uncharacterized protein n=1 Tax=Phaseolus angularis TaxID=3914 RepID=A0A0L9VKD2_PHAAN|nr:hypothetical protein LR48_Vigan10g108600 [Vigna angularis]
MVINVRTQNWVCMPVKRTTERKDGLTSPASQTERFLWKLLTPIVLLWCWNTERRRLNGGSLERRFRELREKEERIEFSEMKQEGAARGRSIFQKFSVLLSTPPAHVTLWQTHDLHFWLLTAHAGRSSTLMSPRVSHYRFLTAHDEPTSTQRSPRVFHYNRAHVHTLAAMLSTNVSDSPPRATPGVR